MSEHHVTTFRCDASGCARCVESADAHGPPLGWIELTAHVSTGPVRRRRRGHFMKPSTVERLEHVEPLSLLACSRPCARQLAMGTLPEKMPFLSDDTVAEIQRAEKEASRESRAFKAWAEVLERPRAAAEGMGCETIPGDVVLGAFVDSERRAVASGVALLPDPGCAPIAADLGVFGRPPSNYRFTWVVPDPTRLASIEIPSDVARALERTSERVRLVPYESSVCHDTTIIAAIHADRRLKVTIKGSVTMSGFDERPFVPYEHALLVEPPIVLRRGFPLALEVEKDDPTLAELGTPSPIQLFAYRLSDLGERLLSAIGVPDHFGPRELATMAAFGGLR